MEVTSKVTLPFGTCDLSYLLSIPYPHHVRLLRSFLPSLFIQSSMQLAIFLLSYSIGAYPCIFSIILMLRFTYLKQLTDYLYILKKWAKMCHYVHKPIFV